MAWDGSEDTPGRGRIRVLGRAARIAGILGVAIAGGAGFLFLLSLLAPPPPPGSTAPNLRRGVAAASPTTPPPSLAPLPTLAPRASLPPPLPAAGDSGLPDRYLEELTADRITWSGDIDGADYRFTHGFGMPLGHTTREAFAVPPSYRSLTATLKGTGATIRFSVLVNGDRAVFDRTIVTTQPPLTVTCDLPDGSTVVLAALFEGGGSLQDAVAIWGDARFSTSPAPGPGCSA